MDIVEKLRGRSEYERHLGVELIYLYHMDVENICAEIERLRKALKPFAEVLKGHWSHQSDDMVLNIGFGDDKRLELRLGDFRLARSALQQKDSE